MIIDFQHGIWHQFIPQTSVLIDIDFRRHGLGKEQRIIVSWKLMTFVVTSHTSGGKQWLILIENHVNLRLFVLLSIMKAIRSCSLSVKVLEPEKHMGQLNFVKNILLPDVWNDVKMLSKLFIKQLLTNCLNISLPPPQLMRKGKMQSFSPVLSADMSKPVLSCYNIILFG